jgi:hypothetical protein
MGEFAEYRTAFFKEIIAHGVSEREDLKKAFPLGWAVPDKTLYSWLRKVQRLPEFSTQRRYVNRFKLGADPEFVFVRKRAARISRDEEYPSSEVASDPLEQRVDAHNLGMRQGQAFGADNNGRLAEIRPHPSRSALKVCASVMNTLRWMGVCFPAIFDLGWKCGAFVHGDGIGGHVHFGRKRPTRQVEIAALDVLSDMFLALGVYPMKEVTARRNGDRLGQHYGAPGDFRLQSHGYEYRTFPSWLDSPSLAFLTLTLAKLVVHNPELVLSFPVTGSAKLQFQRLWNLLAYYKEVDDDALLACYILRRGLPKHEGKDFKGTWGVGMKTPEAAPRLVPRDIPAGPVDVAEMFAHLYEGKPLTSRYPTATWSPLNPPKGYEMAINRAQTIQVKGLGELIWDLCCPEGMKLQIAGATREGRSIVMSRVMASFLPRNWRSKLDPGMTATISDDYSGCTICISPEWREGPRAKQTRKLLLGGMFPIWKVHNMSSDAYTQWKEGREEKKAPSYWKSKVLVETSPGGF